ncbi:putative aminopeptidase FrvX [Tumebacillus sp. BK434]|uniref:M42 family metallopeptidase n=1 Tax=Tumebacillus sp. BK434 TaxID=2512169 RepID=UPI00104C1129|nr:M42 family metallopeptidase [Tumebacillus sp. BK434]TCP55386.1 putative aminopeptidase FrvX [Tumebacillus sp. BK434]
MDEQTKMIKELCDADGIPGFEREVRNKMRELLTPVSDEIITDRLGGIVGKKTGDANGPKIMFAGHLDEIGWMVTYVTPKGFLRFQPMGGWWAHVVLAQRVKIKTRTGEVLGIVGSKAPHTLAAKDRERVLDFKEMFIDVGATSKEEVEEMGIRPGDMIVPISEFTTMRGGDVWVGKALDNRAGCGLAVEVLRRLQNESHPNILFGGATVQEEIQLRGAGVLANLVQPDIAFALDVGVAYDTPGFEGYQQSCNLGDGPLSFIYDTSMIPNVPLRDLVHDTAKELGINLQVDALTGGGQDGGKFHISNHGVPTIALGFATRYIHSHTALLSKKDWEQAADLLVAVIKKLDRKTVDEIHNW